ncbi:MAG: branched-chain alpha-keto acid dehydrogenase subunit E2, partial [Rhodobacter sp. BACL10 MAG-121220-bin24]
AGASMGQISDILTQGGQSTCGRDVNYRISVNAVQIVMRELNPLTNRYEEILSFDPVTEVVPAAYLEAAAESDLRWRVTLAEGVTSWQVVEGLKRADFLEGPIEAMPAEGSLAPESYELERATTRINLIEKMQKRQSDILGELWAERAADLPINSPQEALVLASLIEKETGLADERGKVASVFVNRLQQGMKLQTDPAVIYGLTQGMGILGRGLRQSELERDTPYNTYVNAGLPPTPIANPGRVSISAALNPDQTPYIFFVADGSGGHAFGVTLSEHNANVATWRKLEAQKAAKN